MDARQQASLAVSAPLKLNVAPPPPHFHSPAQRLTRYAVLVPIQGADPAPGQVELRPWPPRSTTSPRNAACRRR